MSIGLLDTDTPLRPLREEIRGRIAEVLERGVYVLGPEVEAFEEEFSSYVGVRHAIGVGNGTDAITIGLRALGVQPGDEVVVPAFTFYASAEAVVNAGARPVFCDVDPLTRNVSAETVHAALTPRARAIVAVDLFGIPAPIAELCEFGLPVLEDAAQAAGASLNGKRATRTWPRSRSTRPRTWARWAMVARSPPTTTRSPSSCARFASTARTTSRTSTTSATTRGWTRCRRRSSASAARVGRLVRGRRAAARAYAEAGIGQYVTAPTVPDGVEPAWHLYMATHDRADDLIAGLDARGIQSRSYYRTPLHRQKAMAPYAPSRADALPVTDELARTNLALPMSATLDAERVAEVVAALAEIAE